MIRRPGVTLTEVLVAIFITGIGMISLLVLFPLGALNMNQAIKDQRAADAARIAASLARAFDLRNDNNAFAAYGNGSATVSGFPSNIAYIDPQGCHITGPGNVGGISGLNRVYPSMAKTGGGVTTGINFTKNTSIQRWTTLQD
jgi:type II secretory pathway pseudopilin PulG